MLFFGLFMLVVTPLFLVYCIQAIKKSDLKGPTRSLLIGLFYAFAGMAILIDLVLLGRVLQYF